MTAHRSSIKPVGISPAAIDRPAQHRARPAPSQMSPELNPQENVWQFMRDNWLFKPDLQILRLHRRPLLRRLEQPRRSTLENHVHRNARMGLQVVISEFWYQLAIIW